MIKHRSRRPAKHRKVDQSAKQSAESTHHGPAEPTQHGIVFHFLTSKSVRETVESVVIAFALAFLFRTFEAEAFVIPTGSMAPTLQGRHQDVDCPMCGNAYRISASQEVDQTTERKRADVVAGECPNCRYWACTNRRLGEDLLKQGYARPFNTGALEVATESSSANGDRIIVSKFAYEFQDPRRWDIFVFRFPGQASRNYIKRLVGLPGDRLMIYHGDIFQTLEEDPSEKEPENVKKRIERKPPDKVRAMAQLVYDNQYQAQKLYQAGWPQRWTSWPRTAEPEANGWQADSTHKKFEIAGNGDDTAWLRYQHIVPSFSDWDEVAAGEATGEAARLSPVPQLISDAYAYNSGYVYPPLYRERSYVDAAAMGMHWVGDLMVECEVEVKGEDGALVLDLVEGGKHFHCTFDLATGGATLDIDGTFYDQQSNVSERPVASTPVKGPGTYRLVFANFDDQLLLWVDETLIAFDLPTTYPSLGNQIPKSDAEDGGDLAPVGIGSRSAHIRVRDLRISRDVYYIATSPQMRRSSDYRDGPLAPGNPLASPTEIDAAMKRVLTDKAMWPEWFAKMNALYFSLQKYPPSERERDQFMALGDNSPQSKDSRLWATDKTAFYVERELLIGKALVIYWPLTHIHLVR